MSNKSAIETMLRAYIDCALRSTNDESDESGGVPMDTNYSADDITPDCLAKMRADVEKFAKENARDIGRWDGIASPETQAGHDFWLTRNGHGAGFWESEWTDLPTNPGARLDAAAKRLGEVSLYVGDDGLIYC